MKQFYDQYEKMAPLMGVLDIDFIAAMAPPSGGRN
jgi:hypothetical protein